MNIIVIRSSTPALVVQPPAGQHRVYHRCSRRDRASDEPRTSSCDGEDVTDNRTGGTLNPDLGICLRPTTRKSP